MIVVVLFAVSLLSVQTTLAHEGGAVPADVWAHWNADPLMLVGLLLPIYLYMRGMTTYPIDSWRILMFIGGIVSLFVALVSPLDAVSGSLFSGHMLQHLLLVLVAAPLLALSRPLAPLLRGLPTAWSRACGQVANQVWTKRLSDVIAQPVTVSILHMVALWVWHLPALYDAALRNPLIHILEHASFFVTALLYWWMIRTARDYGRRVLSVFMVMMASGLLGALMLFSREAWYLGHTPYVGKWGLTPIEDQQLAGLLMWIPAGVVYVVTTAVLLGIWLNSVEQRVLERESRFKREIHDV